MLPSPTRRRVLPVALAAAVALIVGACTGPRPQLSSKVESTTTTPGGGPESTVTSEAAEAKDAAIDVYADATDDTPARQLSVADATSAPDVPLVFLVKRHEGDRLEVYLPTAPAGSTGWVRARDVRLSRVSYRIEISLQNHHMEVFDDGRSVLEEGVSIGIADRPTAGTTYYLKELLQPPDPSGPYGRLAYVFSGANTSVASFTSGEGIIGIHGTSDRQTLGGDTPTGSIGIASEVLDRLADQIGLPLGTPVTVSP